MWSTWHMGQMAYVKSKDAYNQSIVETYDTGKNYGQ